MDFNIQQTLKPPHVAIVPTLGLGHLIPLIELAKRLVVHHNFAVTFIIPNDGSSMSPQKKVLEAVNLQSISSTFLPPIDLDDLPKDAQIEARIILTMTRSLSALRDSLKVLNESTRVVALVVDALGSDAFDVAIECNVPPYMFWSSNAMALSFAFYLPSLDETTSCAYQDMLEPIQLPGCVPLHGRDFLDSVHDRNNQGYKATLGISKKFKLASGIIVNSFMDLEPEIFKALKEAQVSQGFPTVYPVGPVIKPSSTCKSNGEHECLSWLDSQPRGSVLFVAFGSGGTHSLEQMKELALGLEMSGQRFLWVVRSPNETAKNATYFSSNAQQKDPLSFFPDGFLERTKGVGLAVPSWAPQVQVLSHESIGGFLTHCGWNSTLESIVNGVPLIAWPLYAEQRINAVLLADDIKIAWRVKMNDKGIVEGQDIAKYARGLIEGDEGRLLRNKMKELKVALSQQGSSTKSLAEVAEILKGNK
ncbi:hydroquinone glucosyltransferase-like [Prunus yedoensis var. nudiflora]|uniref:Glycosyltransferase n=1 Tax=Prunus yedoensis var. nudiflora TaxID=2094558 RepID=A0A314UIX9_PRUYE|nr:hydroquinone glucosyltransferase-like [Prunus yedoensis var. nudiflora]